MRAPTLVRGMATYMLRLVWPSGYSSSASASAVWLLGLQCTGLRPLVTHMRIQYFQKTRADPHTWPFWTDAAGDFGLTVPKYFFFQQRQSSDRTFCTVSSGAL